MQANLKGNRLMMVLMVISCVMAITGCSSDKSRAIDATRNGLKDPDSAKFGEVTIVDNNDKDSDGNPIKVACVTVNAKNTYGGYTGDQQATVLLRHDETVYLGSSEVSHDSCVQVAKLLGEKH